jgi:hypothetical protein
VSLGEPYSQLPAFETQHALMGAHEGGTSSANAAHRGRGCSGHDSFGRGAGRDSSSIGGCGRGGGSNNFINRRGVFNNSSIDKCPTCQVCKKRGHTADRCWHHFDEDYIPDDKVVAAATGGQGHDGN